MDTRIEAIEDNDPVGAVDRDASYEAKLPVGAAFSSELEEEVPRRIEDLDAAILVVADDDPVGAVDRDVVL